MKGYFVLTITSVAATTFFARIIANKVGAMLADVGAQLNAALGL